MRLGVFWVVALVSAAPARADEQVPSDTAEAPATSQEAPAKATEEAPAEDPGAAPSATEVIDPAAVYARRIDASFQAQANSTVLTCMSRAPGKVRKAGGQLRLDLTVEDDGSLSAVDFQEASTVTHGKTLDCLSQGFGLIVLPKPPEGTAPMSVDYSLDIHPAD